MIANISRISQFQECRRKAQYWAESRLVPLKEAEPLLLGEAVHKGLEMLFKTGDVAVSVKSAEDTLSARVSKQQDLLPEEILAYEQAKVFARLTTDTYAQHYKELNFRVLYPEVPFCVSLPDTTHHCYFVHKILHPDSPEEGCTDPRCMQPHYFMGRADGVVQWETRIWLLETKTTAYTGNIFYDRFQLDFQPTGYMYGVKRAAGITPSGFILNVVKKPPKQFKGTLFDWFNRDPFEREAMLRSEEDLTRFEHDFIQQCNDYENAFRNRQLYMNTKSCTNWNRRCYYWDTCKEHGKVYDGQYRERNFDYVEKEYYRILGLEAPADPDPENQIPEEVIAE